MSKTKIEWTNETWNPVTGCTKISVGCKNCYAERIAYRFAGLNFPARPDHFKVTLHPERLDQPLRMKKPRMIFVCSMSDLFHEDVPAEFIISVFEVMAACPQHTFQVLTKRPERIRSVLFGEEGSWYLGGGDYYPNIWIGFTAENQETLDKRWPVFCDALGTEFFTTFVSLEPLLGPVTLRKPVLTPASHPLKVKYCKPLDWVIVGGETGVGWRYMTQDVKKQWFEGDTDKQVKEVALMFWWDCVWEIKGQCEEAGIPFFFKKPPGGGKLDTDGFTENTPQELRIRQMPERSN